MKWIHPDLLSNFSTFLGLLNSTTAGNTQLIVVDDTVAGVDYTDASYATVYGASVCTINLDQPDDGADVSTPNVNAATRVTAQTGGVSSGTTSGADITICVVDTTSSRILVATADTGGVDIGSIGVTVNTNQFDVTIPQPV